MSLKQVRGARARVRARLRSHGDSFSTSTGPTTYQLHSSKPKLPRILRAFDRRGAGASPLMLGKTSASVFQVHRGDQGQWYQVINTLTRYGDGLALATPNAPCRVCVSIPHPCKPGESGSDCGQGLTYILPT